MLAARLKAVPLRGLMITAVLISPGRLRETMSASWRKATARARVLIALFVAVFAAIWTAELVTIIMA